MVQRLSKAWSSFLRKEEAATNVEYAILLASISVFAVSAILSTGEAQKVLWYDTANAVQVIVNREVELHDPATNLDRRLNLDRKNW